MLLKPGDTVGRYVATERLGVGGMAEVWLVVHQIMGTRHALKVLLHASADVHERLEREGRAQASLKHDNLVPVRDILDIGGAPALLMPLIEGPSLSELLSEYRPTRDEALALFAEILRGVGHAHNHGYVHRDLKPGNVLLDLVGERIRPRVADFGLVKHTASTVMTRDGVMMGTPAYCAPEQMVDAASADEASDLFSLGVMLVELLTGHRPFLGANARLIRAAQLRPPNLSDLEGPLAELCLELLALDPDWRPASCEEVVERLGPCDDRTLEVGELARVAKSGTRRRQAANATTGMARGSEVPNNLPRSRDGFVGRTTELAQLSERVSAGARLATVTGLGGSGKTRLALEFCRSVLSSREGGVHWIDLSEVRDRAGIVVATAGALGVPLGADPEVQLGRAIAGRGHCLLLFDNFEQLTSHGDLLGMWLDAAENALFVVTSRVPLQLRGEWVMALAPLEKDEGVALFAQRAVAANPIFILDDANLGAVGELVSLLDGIPLAVELAAARSRMYSAERLVSRMGQRFRLLRSDSLDLPSRHRTLKATLDWSWDLLSASEREALAQLTVFEGGFTLEHADHVVDLSGFDDPPWVEDVVARLLDHSLLSLSHKGREPRFSMLVSVQVFAAEKLEDSAGAEARHAALFASLAPRNRPTGRVWAAWRAELANLSAAARRARPPEAVACAIAVAEVYRRVGPYGAAVEVIQRAQKMPGLSGVDRSELSYWLGALEFRLGAVDAAATAFEDALWSVDEAASPRAAAMARLGRFNVRESRGEDHDALDDLRGISALLEGAGDEVQGAIVRQRLGSWQYVRGRVEEAVAILSAVQQVAQTPGRELPRLEAIVLNLLAHHSASQGRSEEAVDRMRRAVRLAHDCGDVLLEMNLAGNLRSQTADDMDPDERMAAEVQARKDWLRLGDLTKAGMTEGRMGLAWLARGDHDRASEWLHLALKTHQSTDHAASQSHWFRGLAEISLARGDVVQAGDSARRAVELAAGMPYLANPAAEMLARVVAAENGLS